jgi:hypothetical protein
VKQKAIGSRNNGVEHDNKLPFGCRHLKRVKKNTKNIHR